MICDRHERCRGRAGRYRYRKAYTQAWFYGQVNRVIVDCESAQLRAVGPGQVLPFPAAANWRAVEITFVANQIAFNAFDPGAHDPVGEIVNTFEVIAVIESRGD